jgi:hypothetical protein
MAFRETGWEIPNINDYTIGLSLGTGERGAGPSVSSTVGRVGITIVEPPNTQGRNRQYTRFVGYGTCIGGGVGLSLPDAYEDILPVVENVLGNLVGFANNFIPLPGGGSRLFGWDRTTLRFSDFEMASLISIEVSASASLAIAGSARAYGFFNFANWFSSPMNSTTPPPGAFLAGFIKYGVQASGGMTVGAELKVCGYGSID